MTKQPQGINDAHAIDADDVAVADVAVEVGIGACVDQLGDVERDMLAAFTCGDCRQDALDRFAVREKVDRKAKQRDPHGTYSVTTLPTLRPTRPDMRRGMIARLTPEGVRFGIMR